MNPAQPFDRKQVLKKAYLRGKRGEVKTKDIGKSRLAHRIEYPRRQFEQDFNNNDCAKPFH
jgi:hypothetical protein